MATSKTKSKMQQRVSVAIAKKNAKDKAKSSSSSSSSSSGKETVAQTVARAKAMLGSAYKPSTPSKTNSSSAPKESVATTVARAQAMNAQTTAQGATPFAGSNFQTELLKKPEAPLSADQITRLSATQVPDIMPDVVDPTNAIAGIAGLSIENQRLAELQQKQSEALLAREKENQKQQQTFMDKILGKNGENLTSPTEARDQAWQDTGMDVQKYFAKQEAGIKEIESLNNDYAAIVAARDQQIAQTNDKMGSMNFINNQTAQIERNAAPKLNEISANISSKAATLQAQQGNFAEARSYVNDAIDAATADTKFKMDMFTTFYNINQDNFERTQSIYADAFKNQMAIAQQEHEENVAQKTLIGEYMMKYPTAGLKITDSFEEASRKIGAIAKTTGVGSTESKRRAAMVLNGQAALTDYTTAEQADIRDAIWAMSSTDEANPYVAAMSKGSQTSRANLDSTFNELRMRVAGPGTGSKDTGNTVTDTNYSAGLTYLYSSGATASDIEKYKTDPDFRDWAIAKAASE
jgi:hypothetical protein